MTKVGDEYSSSTHAKSHFKFNIKNLDKQAKDKQNCDTYGQLDMNNFTTSKFYNISLIGEDIFTTTYGQ